MANDRYSRQELFSPIGLEGQRKIRDKHVLIIGAGALGTSNAEQLARAGIGRLTIVDRDYVEWSNLQRQQLFTETDAEKRMPKAVAAEKRLKEVNTDVFYHSCIMDVQREELEELIQEVDVLIDATDNFDTRMLINDVCQKHQVPWIYGGCAGSHGMSYTIVPGKTPCLHCLMGQVPLGGATCDTVGVISPAVQMTAAHQVAEALKLLVDDVKALYKKLIIFDMWKHSYTGIAVQHAKREDCPSCGSKADYPFMQQANQTKSAVLCGRDTVQIRPPRKMERDFNKLKESLPETEIEENPFLLSFKREGYRFVFFRDGRVLIHGTKDITAARRLYYKIVG
ncbi:thiazole biosynthesis adenylyltransferase ThiF [Halobacillus massiliensis]|uniref:thiazole biosynthesis adenylyltransferase ThiF n=1 Tax=Halobacillus massiliensis TaxID=1926286 RepID=UPI0009E27436|nr:thiazole biosynthesis adenylyltransferase ThiF [Halobacillus massiliensis]